MGLFLSFIGMIGFLVMTVILIIGALKKKGKAKKHGLIIGLFFIIFIAGVILQPTPEGTMDQQTNTKDKTVVADKASLEDKKVKEKESEEEKEEAKKKAEAEKAAEEAKKKAEAEKAAEEARKKAEAEKAAEEAKKKEEELAKKRAEEEAAKKAAKEAEEKRKAEEKKNEIPGTLEITAEEFKSQWNEALDSFDLDDDTLKINRMNVSEGNVQGSFQTMLTQNIAVAGTINKADNSVRDILIVGQGDGTASSGAEMMVSFALLVGATNPSLSADDRGQVFRDLGLFDEGAELSTIDSSIVTNGVKYSLDGTAADSFGVTFSAGDPEDN